MCRQVWAWDVDGCVTDLLGGRSLRPLVKEVLAALNARGCVVVLWSAGGAEHARRKAELFGLEGSVSGYYDKGSADSDGRWSTAHFPPHHQPDVCVDDAPEALPAHVRRVPVRPYTAPSAHDRALAPLLESLVTSTSGDPFFRTEAN